MRANLNQDSGKTFLETLEEQMRIEIRAELEREYGSRKTNSTARPGEAPDLGAARAGQFESWMASHVGKSFFSGHSTIRKAYGVPLFQTVHETPPSRRELTLEEILAVELLRRHSGVPLDENFRPNELRSAWRKAALRSHPDRFANADPITQTHQAALFREIAEAHELLAKI